MKPDALAPILLLPTRTGTPGLDIVVPYTTRPLTRAALAAAGRLSAELLPLIRMVRTQVVPFPLQMETPPVSSAALRRELVPLAEEFRAHLQICFARDEREGLLHLVSKDSVTLIAAHRRWWNWLWPSREERLAKWMRARGYFVVLEFVEKNHA
jgi:hypothetical protein